MRPERVPQDSVYGASALVVRCEADPIHVPGAVQGHGALLAFDRDEGRVVYRSENLQALLGLAAEPLGMQIDDAIGVSARAQIVRVADDSILDLVPVTLALPAVQALDMTAHRSDGLVVAEFEPAGAPEEGHALLHEARRAVERVEVAPDVVTACAVAVEEVRRLAGYARVMVYRFHDDEHGEVVAEARRDDIGSYLGLHYPAADIPRPARRLLRLSPLRLIADVDAPTVAIAGHGGLNALRLDLSRSALRAVAPIHLQYLRNMGVAASLTLALTDGPRLWGLLACHHDEPKLPSPELRSACVILARALWLKIDVQEASDAHSDDQRRVSLRARFLATVSSATELAEALVEDGHSLLDLVDAGGVALRIEGVSTTLGATPPRDQIAALHRHLAESNAASVVVTEASGDLFPELGLPPATAAGILAFAGPDGWDDHVIWFRGEVERKLTWAGDPAKPVEGAEGELGPRRSFAAWTETMRGHAPQWTRSERVAAAELAESLPEVRAVRARDVLAKLALRDTLTGLPNRALLLDRIGAALAEGARSARGLSILFLDLDGFKEVNDGFGHEAGDRVLCEVASRLRGCVRGTDTVARLGGDEFVILCGEEATQKAIDSLAERLLAALAEPFVVLGQTCELTVSIGIATVDRTATPAQAVDAADAAMYRAKRLGRNRAAR